MNPRTTIVLAVAALLLTAAAWWDAGRTEFHFQRDLDQPFSFPESAIEGIAIETPTVAAELEKVDGRWRIAAPIEFPAEWISVEAITHLVHELRVRGEGEGASETGLGTPRATVRLRVTGHGDRVLRIGASHPTLPYIYADVAGEVILVDPLIGEALEALTLTDLRSTALVDVPAVRAERLTVERGAARFTARRRDDQWRLLEPEIGTAEPGKVVDALHALNSWGVHSFVADNVTAPEDLENYGLARPEGRIEVEERHTGRMIALAWGNRIELPDGGGAGVYVLIEDSATVVRATAALFPRLPADSAEWESRQIVRIPARDVDRVVAVGRYRKVTLDRDGRGGWRVTWAADGVPRPAESALFVTMVESLRGATVESFVPLDSGNLQKYGFDRPIVDITIRHGGGEERVMVGDAVEEGSSLRYVWNYTWTKAGLAIFPDLDRWAGAPFTLRSLDLVPVPPDVVGRIRVGDGSDERTWVRGEGGWRAIGPRGEVPPATQSALDELLIARGVSWEANPPPTDRAVFSVELLPLEPFEADPWVRLESSLAPDGVRWVRTADSAGAIRVGEEAGETFRVLLEDLRRGT